jgi:uncharacterized protein (TIGR01777 family)
MKILVAGSSGMIGIVLVDNLIKQGYTVVRLVRHKPGPGETWWDPEGGEIDCAGIEGFEGVVHLASMPWPMRWTAKAKQELHHNRLATNCLIVNTLMKCVHKPEVLICASGMGYYASSGDSILTEESPNGTSFLAQLQQAGESSAAIAMEAGIRVVNLRIAPVMGGNAVKRMGFQMGNGRQWNSWVSRDELVSIIEFILRTKSVAGPVNPVSPNPLRNADLTIRTAHVLGVKPRGKMPTFLVRLLMGEMGDELMLSSRRMLPAKLLAAGYQFQFPEFEQALKHELDVLNTISS